MIEVEHISKKFSRLYRTVDDIKNFKIRIRLINEDADNEDVVTFKWQQKRFSPQERETYSNPKNCFTDLEKEYHEMITEGAQRDDAIIFSYTDRDQYHAEEKLLKNQRTPNNSNSELIRLMTEAAINESDKENAQNKPVNDGIEGNNQNDENDLAKYSQNELSDNEYDFIKSLTESQKHVVINSKYDTNTFEEMHLMVDFGEFYQSTWIKSEHILCTIKYNPKEKILIMKPDFTLFKGYTIRVTSDVTRTYQYFIENASMDGLTSKEIRREFKLLSQLKSTRGKKIDNVYGIEWSETPSLLNVHVFLEIQSAWKFEYDNVFIRYYIDLKNSWTLIDSEESFLLGGTYSCASVRNQSGRMHFGFPIDFTITAKLEATECPIIYFEVISKDTWYRYRCEGLAYMVIPIWQPGMRTDTLSCYRLTEGTGVHAELKRFFIGDCSNFKSITALNAGANERYINRLATQTVSSGFIKVRVGIMHVVGTTDKEKKSHWEYLRELRLRNKLNDPQLTKAVEDVMNAFKKAKAAMTEARKAV